MKNTIKIESGGESMTVHDSAMYGLVVPFKEVDPLLTKAYIKGMQDASVIDNGYISEKVSKDIGEVILTRKKLTPHDLIPK